MAKKSRLSNAALAPPTRPDSVLRIVEKLGLDPDAIIHASAEQGLLFMNAAEYRVTCLTRRNSCKSRLDADTAAHALAVRRAAEKSGEKITEGKIANELAADSVLESRRNDLAVAEEEVEYSYLLLEALRMRRDMLRILNDQQRSGPSGGATTYPSDNYGDTVDRLTDARQAAREKYGKRS